MLKLYIGIGLLCIGCSDKKVTRLCTDLITDAAKIKRDLAKDNNIAFLTTCLQEYEDKNYCTKKYKGILQDIDTEETRAKDVIYMYCTYL